MKVLDMFLALAENCWEHLKKGIWNFKFYSFLLFDTAAIFLTFFDGQKNHKIINKLKSGVKMLKIQFSLPINMSSIPVEFRPWMPKPSFKLKIIFTFLFMLFLDILRILRTRITSAKWCNYFNYILLTRKWLMSSWSDN